MVYMKKVSIKCVVLPKALTEKVIPQFAEMPTANIEDNLYYFIKLMPATFSDEVKKELTAKYTATINEKNILNLTKWRNFFK
jgi:uncharacterized protein (DUF885 family)